MSNSEKSFVDDFPTDDDYDLDEDDKRVLRGDTPEIPDGVKLPPIPSPRRYLSASKSRSLNSSPKKTSTSSLITCATDNSGDWDAIANVTMANAPPDAENNRKSANKAKTEPHKKSTLVVIVEVEEDKDKSILNTSSDRSMLPKICRSDNSDKSKQRISSRNNSKSVNKPGMMNRCHSGQDPLNMGTSFPPMSDSMLATLVATETNLPARRSDTKVTKEDRGKQLHFVNPFS